MRTFAILVLAAATAVVAGIGLAGASNTSSHTALKITYWPNGQRTADSDVWTLRCNPAGGTLARPANACRRLAAGGFKLFAPVPGARICTQIYGGPQVARVIGALAGRRVWVRFSREDGCQLSRWNRLSPWLLPAGGVTR